MDEKLTVNRLVEKSKESFILGIEVYNKPTIKYRIEGFSFFICNAWELLLKAHLINLYGYDKIIHKNNTRVKGLSDCIKMVFTNNKDPLRINLEKIIELRNTSTHFIVEEYEQIYVPLFQSCVFNYIDKLEEFFNNDITKMLSSNFIVLATNYSQLTLNDIEAKYPADITNKIVNTSAKLQELSKDNNDKFSISIVHNYYQTKDKKKAVVEYRFAKNANEAALIIKNLKDPNETHKYTQSNCISEINKRIKREQIKFISYSAEKYENKFNRYHFQLFRDYYDLTAQEKFCYIHRANNTKTYSQLAIDFIYDEIKKDPEYIIQNLKKQISKK